MLVAGLALTGLFARNRQVDLLARAGADFDAAASRLGRAVVGRITLAGSGLQGAVAAIAAMGTLDRAALRR